MPRRVVVFAAVVFEAAALVVAGFFAAVAFAALAFAVVDFAAVALAAVDFAAVVLAAGFFAAVVFAAAALVVAGLLSAALFAAVDFAVVDFAAVVLAAGFFAAVDLADALFAAVAFPAAAFARVAGAFFVPVEAERAVDCFFAGAVAASSPAFAAEVVVAAVEREDTGHPSSGNKEMGTGTARGTAPNYTSRARFPPRRRGPLAHDNRPSSRSIPRPEPRSASKCIPGCGRRTRRRFGAPEASTCE